MTSKKELTHKLLTNPLLFATYFFKFNQNKDFVVGDHHKIISNLFRDIFTLKKTRVMINLPPRYSKTELIRNFMAMGFAINAASKFIYTSYSEKLALDTSESVRDILKDEEYFYHFGIKTKKDSDTKSKWYTEDGGGVYATSSGGQITGFGAGELNCNYFAGALIVDDPIKVDDANSIVTRQSVIKNYDETLTSRLNDERTPIIIIMQRLHPNDLCGYLLEKEPDKWHVLTMKALQENGQPLWPKKHTLEDLYYIRRTRPHVFYAQYQQEPRNIKSGGEFLESFELNKHVKTVEKQDKQIHVSIDNNLLPYCAVSVWQIEDNKVKQITELPAIDPDNSAPGAGRIVKKYLEKIGYNDTLFVYGDPTTKNKSTIDSDKKSFLDLFLEQLKDYRVDLRMSKRNISVSNMGAFVNACLSGETDISIEIDESCKRSINDYVETKKDVNGGILKKRITDPTTKQSYEENGHFTDTMKDFICQAFKHEFEKWINKKQSPKIIW